VRDNNGVPQAIDLWDYEDVTVLADKTAVYYKHKDFPGKVFLNYEVFHITGFGFNGIRGKSVVEYAADNMGISYAADQFGATAYGQSGVSYGVIETERELKDIGKRNIRTLVKQDLKDIGNHKIAVLDEGMKYKTIALSPQQAQFIEAKAAGVEDIARWLNIPLHKLHTKGEGGYNFLVQMSIEYLQSAVMPWGQKIKEEIQRKLLTRPEKEIGHYCFVNYRKLLEADPKSRAEYYRNMVYMKAMVPNEVRELEDMNPIDGGDQPLQLASLQTEAQIQKEISDG
jgi:HK97 family phage portal protein